MRRVPRLRAGPALAVGCGLAVALAAGCGSSGGSTPPASTPPASTAAASVAAARALGITRARLAALDAQYLSIATPANRRLDTDNDGFTDAEHHSLATARKFLLSEIATERQFDAELARIAFPPPVEQQARALVRANNQRIALTRRQAAATTLSALRALDSQHKAADAAVERPVRQIRAELALPPPATSLPTVAA